MKIKITIVLLIFSLFLTAMPFSFAQTSQNDWSAVQKLTTGTDLFIKTSNGKTIKGSLVTVNDNEVELSVKGSNRVLPRNNIEAIYFAVPKSGKRARLIGAGVGFLAGAAAAGTLNRDVIDERDYNYSALVYFPIAGLISGAFIGGLFGKGKKKGALIYKAK
ncbi:MAG: hypothetical protein LH472_07925 [Pyrinomonadaceae bacterium]|nr:hypothetical protein [Pyrinomonadaceae bacterium]